jgi:hypothetical protein
MVVEGRICSGKNYFWVCPICSGRVHSGEGVLDSIEALIIVSPHANPQNGAPHAELEPIDRLVCNPSNGTLDWKRPESAPDSSLLHASVHLEIREP